MITTSIIRIINADITSALKSVAEKHNVKITLGASRYSEAEYSCKFTVATKEAEGKRKEEELRISKMMLNVYHLPADTIGKVIQRGGETYKILRINTKSTKYPVIYQSILGGTKYKMSVDQLNRWLGVRENNNTLIEEEL